MSEPSSELEILISQLEQGEISKAEFERRSSEFIDGLGSAASQQNDVVRRERIEAAEKMLRSL
jgi:hypothetical protein